MAKFGAKQGTLLGIILICALFIFYTWWEGPTGPAGKNRYGVVAVSWKATGPGNAGILTVNIDRAPQHEFQGGMVTSATGVELLSGATATPSDARSASSLLPEVITRARISKADAGAMTLEFPVSPPLGWPAGVPLPKSKEGGWSMPARQKKGRPGEASAGALGFLQIVPGGGPAS